MTCSMLIRVPQVPTIVSGNGTNTVVVSGTLSQLNALLAATGATGSIQFTDVINQQSPDGMPSTSVSYTINDRYNGVASPQPNNLTATATQAITINPVVTNTVNNLPATGATNGSYTIFGGGANDILFGAGGADYIAGGYGNDIIYGDSAYLSNWSFENWSITNGLTRNSSGELNFVQSGSTVTDADIVSGWVGVDSLTTTSGVTTYTLTQNTQANSMQLIDGGTGSSGAITYTTIANHSLQGQYFVDAGRGSGANAIGDTGDTFNQIGFQQTGLVTLKNGPVSLSFTYTTLGDTVKPALWAYDYPLPINGSISYCRCGKYILE